MTWTYDVYNEAKSRQQRTDANVYLDMLKGLQESVQWERHQQDEHFESDNRQ